MIEQPLVLLNEENIYPLSLFLFSVLEQEIDTGFAASVLFMLPVLAVFFLGRNHIIKGIQLSGFR
jgi:multiple sugar transport system permease protein